MMKKRGIYMPYLLRRIGEVFGFEILVSMIISVLGAARIIPSTAITGGIMAFIQIVLNLAFQFFCLRVYCSSFRNLRGVYYRTNLFAAMVFIMAAAVLALSGVEPLYTYLFMPMKFFCYVAGMDKFLSAIIVGLIYVAEIPVVSALVPAAGPGRNFAAE